ncbi:MAG: FHA domain-containing protein [Myxococcales bacterium]|nr:FHA domain-containing protein [Myxococcales bacterium]
MLYRMVNTQAAPQEREQALPLLGLQPFAETALRRSRAQFVAACPFFFLVGGSQLVRPEGPRATATIDKLGARFTPERSAAPTTILAVRKVRETFPSMITLGRTDNNDLVLHDVSVSKFHAFFRMRGGQLEVAEGGSRNGTWVGTRRVDARSPGRAVKNLDTLRFGLVEFTLLDAGACWDRLRPEAR